MPQDSERLAALRQGITAAPDDGYVAIRVADVRWLLDRAESQPIQSVTDDSEDGDHDEHDEE
jgi:hypothetical protein